MYRLLAKTVLLLGCLTTPVVRDDQDGPNEPAKSPVSVSVSLDDQGATYNRVVLKFTNTGPKRRLNLLRPLDGSLWCWLMPRYAFTVKDQQGRAVPLMARCGNYGHPFSGTKWPGDYLIKLDPGKSISIPVCLPHKVPRDGKYTVEFEYVYDLKPASKTPGGQAYPITLWRGSVKSEPVQLELRKR